ncbi:MAG TPA: protease modulator HflC [bacterium]|nr:protease modulator HflC [bacterium]
MKKLTTLVILVIILVFIGTTALFVLDETEQAIVTQFGKPIGDPIMKPGLHFKIPFVQTVTKFEKRILEWDGTPQEVPTEDNKFIHIDTYARWQIEDALEFYKSVHSENQAQSRLDDIIDGAIRDEMAVHTLPNIVRSNRREMEVVTVKEEEEVQDIKEAAQKDSLEVREKIVIDGERDEIRENIIQHVTDVLEETDLGVKLIDFRFKRIDYNTDVQKKVFQRMIAQQNKIAEKYRAIGQGERERIMGKIEQKRKEILSGAYRKGQKIRGEADGEATEIYAEAYNRSETSRNFYEFLRTMTAYENSIDSTSTLLLSTDNELLKYFKSSK